MNLVDANVLLDAVNTDAEHHDASRSWLDDSLSGAATVGFSWIAVLAFLRLATKAGLFPRPLPVLDALDQVEAWTSSPAAVVVEPTARHLSIVRALLRRQAPVETSSVTPTSPRCPSSTAERSCRTTTISGGSPASPGSGRSSAGVRCGPWVSRRS